MVPSSKCSGRVIGLLVLFVAFAAACAQLLGDVDIDRRPLGPCSTMPLNGALAQADCPLTPVDSGAPPPPPICEESQIRCEGRALQSCIVGGTAWFTLQTCDTPALCRTSDVSIRTECAEPACGVDQMSCDGNVLRHCNSDRTGWEIFDTCESAAHCDAGKRQCQPAPCDAGDRRCNLGQLERCNESQTDWEQLDRCVTNEICEATLQGTAPGLVSGGVADGPPLAQVPARDADGPIDCLPPACDPNQAQCDGVRLNTCVEGRTGFELAEPCATAALCLASITYTGVRGSPRCLRPVCDPSQHRCVGKNLEVCNESRDGFRQIEECIGPPFCNSAAADDNRPGCEPVPCQPGQERCSGPQIERCRADQTGFETIGTACDTRELCIDDDPVHAFCRPPVCQRGAQSATEFRCQGALLQRCNEQHTGYEALNTCATSALCNASLGFRGCVDPPCAPNQMRCNGDLLQACTAERTGFESVERCAPGTCDSVAGKCTDPCVLGSARCNSLGELEECRDPLVGRQISARCSSPELCDATARACRQPPVGCTADGVKRCLSSGANRLLQVCTAGRSRFDTLDTCTPGEFCDVNNDTCDVCDQNGPAACEGSNLVRCAPDGQSQTPTPCAQGCQVVATGPDRCFNCLRGAASCTDTQLSVCVARGATDESIQLQSCGTAQRCSSELASCNSGAMACQCEVCDGDDTACDGRFPTRCNAAHTAFERVLGPNGVAKDCLAVNNCNPSSGDCFPCAVGDVSCAGGVLQGCRLDRSGFEPIAGATPGSIRCSSDNGGQFSQLCTGASLTEERCTAPEALCNPNAGGCVACLPGPAFVSVCTSTADGQPGHTQCQGGQAVVNACEDPLNSPCQEGICSGAGQCVFGSRERGASCIRTGGAAGVCDGLQRDPRCVECVDDGRCDDGNVCTADSCGANGSCGHVAVAGACRRGDALAGVCSAGSCAECALAADCNDGNDCTTDSCGAGSCVHSPAAGACSLGGSAAGVCTNGSCQPAQLCPPNRARCAGNTSFRCNAAGTEETAELCEAGSTCEAGTCVRTCGNGQLDTGEGCDGGLGLAQGCGQGQSGSLTCNLDCTQNRSGCHPTTCADITCPGAQVCDAQTLGCEDPPSGGGAPGAGDPASGADGNP